MSRSRAGGKTSRIIGSKPVPEAKPDSSPGLRHWREVGEMLRISRSNNEKCEDEDL